MARPGPSNERTANVYDCITRDLNAEHSRPIRVTGHTHSFTAVNNFGDRLCAVSESQVYDIHVGGWVLGYV